MLICPEWTKAANACSEIIEGILVARHLKTTDDLFDNRSNPRTESLVAAAVQWAERIMRKVDNLTTSK